MRKQLTSLLSLSCIAALALVFSGCQSTSTQSTGASAPAKEPSRTSSTVVQDTEWMTSKEWVLKSLNNAVVDASAYKQLPTLKFDTASSHVAGITPVNNYSATYTMSGTNVTLSPAISTRKAGPQPDMELENKYNAMLASVTGWRIMDGQLFLISGDAVIATFTEQTK